MPICYNGYNGLISLPEIKKDLASMMLSEIYDILNLILDNNVKRIVRLLEFTRSDNLEKIPADVVKVFVEKLWAKVTYLNSKNS